MANASLNEFIQHARDKGMDHATIRTILLSAGWKEKDVAEAITAQTLDMPVPMPPDLGGARDAFFHLLTFSMLFVSLGSLIFLFFEYIDRLFPDPAFAFDSSSDYLLSSIRWSLAALVVAFPLFIWFSRILAEDMRRHAEKSYSGVRRWLTYLTLFIAASTMAGDVITLVYYLLEGELSIRFLLHVFVILFLAGTTFTYYFLSLRLAPADPRRRTVGRTFQAVAVTVAAVAVVWGGVLVGSPAAERQRKFDERRVEDLRDIGREIRSMCRSDRSDDDAKSKLKRPLPKTLDEVAQAATYRKLDITDPETGAPYRYEITGESTFRLCATYSTERDQRWEVFWNHPAGDHCFDFDVFESPAGKEW
ncbi:MAG: DUF5671 domain-containing protein [Pirellulales bacterium]